MELQKQVRKQGWKDLNKDGNSFGVNCFEGDIILIFILFILNAVTEFVVVLLVLIKLLRILKYNKLFKMKEKEE